jgi:glutathione synthase/RimK-type ligase-like ATP-grasp enzyme
VKSIYILLDYLHTYGSRYDTNKGFNLDRIKKLFNEFGFNVIYKKFTEVNFRSENYQNEFVLYQSSEDTLARYNSFIEDILFGINIQGGILIPKFEYFRAHDNKIFMEILRDLSLNKQIKNITSKYFGTYEEYFERMGELKINQSYVIKSAKGSGSLGVALINDEKSRIEIPKKLSASNDYIPFWHNLYKLTLQPFYLPVKNIFVKRKKYDLLPISSFRNKFLIQNYITDIKNDYKILIFNDKYYVLFRNNRKGDFRASGSGNFIWIEEVSERLLDYAKEVFDSFKVPFASFDICYDENDCYLFEMQFIMFGSLTMEESKFYFKKTENGWTKDFEKPDIEKEAVISTVSYINKYYRYVTK